LKKEEWDETLDETSDEIFDKIFDIEESAGRFALLARFDDFTERFLTESPVKQIHILRSLSSVAIQSFAFVYCFNETGGIEFMKRTMLLADRYLNQTLSDADAFVNAWSDFLHRYLFHHRMCITSLLKFMHCAAECIDASTSERIMVEHHKLFSAWLLDIQVQHTIDKQFLKFVSLASDEGIIAFFNSPFSVLGNMDYTSPDVFLEMVPGFLRILRIERIDLSRKFITVFSRRFPDTFENDEMKEKVADAVVTLFDAVRNIHLPSSMMDLLKIKFDFFLPLMVRIDNEQTIPHLNMDSCLLALKVQIDQNRVDPSRSFPFLIDCLLCAVLVINKNSNVIKKVKAQVLTDCYIKNCEALTGDPAQNYFDFLAAILLTCSSEGKFFSLQAPDLEFVRDHLLFYMDMLHTGKVAPSLALAYGGQV